MRLLVEGAVFSITANVWIMGALISDSDKMRIWEKYNREIKKLNK